LNEQEAVVLRRKVEDLEQESRTYKQQIKELGDNLAVKIKEVELITRKHPMSASMIAGTRDPLDEQKIKVMEDEISELRTKLIEKDREFERVQAEISLSKGKGKLTKSK
jgi:predicted RNase H-like nuclease (RuvC/YqgF family)